MGGTNIAVGVVDDAYNIVGKASVKTNCPRPAEDIADSMKEAVLLAVEDAGIDMEEIASVGVGTPGAVTKEGVVEFSANLGFYNTPLKELVSARVGKPTYIENDANCAALGEALAGCGNGVKNFIAVTLGTGVGGGIIVDGKLLRGINGAAGEIGHMTLVKNGLPCQCGRYGCFEQYASASALVRQTIEALKGDLEKTSAMWDYVDNGRMESVDGMTAFKAAREGDFLARQVVSHFVDHLGTGITDLINIFQPEVLCIGGGLSKEGDFLLNPVREMVFGERYTKFSFQQTAIRAAKLGNDAGIIGAALLDTQ